MNPVRPPIGKISGESEGLDDDAPFVVRCETITVAF